MWVAKFKLKDDQDIYSPLCSRFSINFFASPYSNFIKDNKINLLVGGIVSGSEENKKRFFDGLKKDKRVKSVENYNDYILVHAQHPLSREAKAEIAVFYNPQYIRTRPVSVAADGWEYWEVACLDRNELNKIVQAAIRHYHGEIFYVRKEKLKNVSSLELSPGLTEKQAEAIKLAFKEGYYGYPRGLTIPQLARMAKRSYSTFQENLSRAENKIVEYFVKYR